MRRNTPSAAEVRTVQARLEKQVADIFLLSLCRKFRTVRRGRFVKHPPLVLCPVKSAKSNQT